MKLCFDGCDFSFDFDVVVPHQSVFLAQVIADGLKILASLVHAFSPAFDILPKLDEVFDFQGEALIQPFEVVAIVRLELAEKLFKLLNSHVALFRVLFEIFQPGDIWSPINRVRHLLSAESLCFLVELFLLS